MEKKCNIVNLEGSSLFVKQVAEVVSVKIELKQEIKIEPINESDPQLKMEPDINPLGINRNCFKLSINRSQTENENQKYEQKKNRLTKIQMPLDLQYGNVRYSCDQCDHKATQKGDLKKHIDSVHGDVWYSCDQCDYKTKWKGNLKAHKDSLHGDVWHSCDQCDYKTKWKGNLKAHLDSVHGDVWHSCDQCDYKSKWKGNLKKHIDSLHGLLRKINK